MRVQHRHQHAPELVEALDVVRAHRPLDVLDDENSNHTNDRIVATSGPVVVRWSVGTDGVDRVDVLVCELAVINDDVAVVPTTRVCAP